MNKTLLAAAWAFIIAGTVLMAVLIHLLEDDIRAFLLALLSFFVGAVWAVITQHMEKRASRRL